MFANYVHHLDPVVLKITEMFQIRWYGLAYLAGFLAGFYLLKFLARRKLWVLKEVQVSDFIAALALFGVFVGGRLGYILFYMIPGGGWHELVADPLLVFKVWKGGMASHGGILGIAIFTWFYARKHKLSWTGLGDAVCVVAPIGLFFGRIANFINGELYGRVSDGVAWAVVFPQSIIHLPEEVSNSAWAECAKVDGRLEGVRFSPELLVEVSRDNPAVREVLTHYIPARHPSQIYEALLEGVLLFAVLWFIRMRFPKAPHGLLTAVFFGLYALVRILGEQFREPDSALVGSLTKGQFLSFFMFVFAAAFGWHAWRQTRQPARSGGG